MAAVREDEDQASEKQSPRDHLTPTASLSGQSALFGRSPAHTLDRVQSGPQDYTAQHLPPKDGPKGWTALRNRMKGNDGKGVQEISKALTGHELVSELTVGLLPVMMLKMGLTDRDEHGAKRIPVS